MDIETLIDAFTKDKIRLSDIDKICKDDNLVREDLFNQIAVEIAKRFDAGLIKFEYADLAINCLWGNMVEDASEQGDGFSLARPAFEIYEAFDAGEYVHKDGEDPVEKYTKPLVTKILSRC